MKFLTRLSFAFIFLFLIGLFLFNLRYLSRFFDWDSVIYTINIQRSLAFEKKPIERHLRPVFYNPHHLGFESTGYAYLRWIRSLYPQYDTMFILRMRILVWGLIFLFIFIFLHYRLYRKLETAFVLALVIFFSQGYWFYSHHNDTPLLPATIIALTFLLAVYFMRKGFSYWSLLLTGLVQLFSVYFHQSNAIFLLLIPLALLVSKRFKMKSFSLGKKLRISFIYVTSIVALLTVSYLFVGFLILKTDLKSKGENHFTNWLFLYVTLDRWGASKTKKDYVMHFYRGIGDVFLNYKRIQEGTRVDFSKPFEKWTIRNAPYNLNLMFWAGIIFLFVINLRRILQKYGKEIFLLFFWLIPSLIFYTWWEGYFFEFWVSTSIALWLFSFWVLDSLDWQPIQQTSRAFMNLAYIAMLFLLFSVNFTFSILPRSEKVSYGNIISSEKHREQVIKMSKEKIYRHGLKTLPSQ